jgi:hypothetical protein
MTPPEQGTLRMKLLMGAVCTAAAASLAISAFADPYKDYTPRKGAWQITEVHVDPNHIDDYLTGLKTTWVQGNELAKKHGIIDDYQVMVRMDAAGGGANVLLAQHYPSLAALEPDQARDEAIRKEGLAIVSKEKGEAMVAGYEKYRSFVGDGFWTSVEFPK